MLAINLMISNAKDVCWSAGQSRGRPSNAAAAAWQPPRANTETHRNGRSARADDASMFPSTLDRENGGVQSSVRSFQISRGRLSVPRQWQYAKTLVRPSIRRLSVVAGTARARWLWQLAMACWTDVLTIIAADAGRSLGPMLPASARERWPFFVVRTRLAQAGVRVQILACLLLVGACR